MHNSTLTVIWIKLAAKAQNHGESKADSSFFRAELWQFISFLGYQGYSALIWLEKT